MLATTDNVTESLKSAESAETDQILRKSLVTHSFVDLAHQIIIHQRWTPTSRLIVHVLSSFIEHPNPFPNHAITHRNVTIHLTDLVTNLTWQHIPSVQTTNYRRISQSAAPSFVFNMFNAQEQTYTQYEFHEMALWLLNR